VRWFTWVSVALSYNAVSIAVRDAEVIRVPPVVAPKYHLMAVGSSPSNLHVNVVLSPDLSTGFVVGEVMISEEVRC